MSNKNYSVSLIVSCALAIVFLSAAVVDAQTQEQIRPDDLVASVTAGGTVWVTPAHLAPALELATGQSASLQTLSELLEHVPQATSTNGVRFEGGYPTGGAVLDLQQLGYLSTTPSLPTVPGADIAEVWSD